MTDLFADKGPDGRYTNPWATPFVGIGIVFAGLVISAIVVLIFGVVYGAMIAAGGDGSIDQDALAGATMVAFIASFFPAMALATIFWVKFYEKRKLASIGFRRFFPTLYLRGVAVGIACALGLLVLGGLAATAMGVEAPDFPAFQPDMILAQDFLVFLAITALIFFVQSASEEILVRGWMLSALFARSGFILSLLVSSIFFGLLHSDRIFLNPILGIVGLFALSMVGLFLALYAVRERSIWGVCGVHGGFNVTLIGLTLIGLRIESGGEADGMELVSMALADITEQMANTDGWPVSVAQFVLFAILSLLLWKGANAVISQLRASEDAPQS